MTALLQLLATPVSAGDDTALACGLCAHRCVLRPGRTGVCGAITNDRGALRSLAFGQPAVLHTDPIERKPLYHMLPGARVLSLGTLGCNMSCTFCQNWRVSQVPPDPATTSELVPPQAVVATALAQECVGIAFTYNEPTIYLDYAAEIMRLAKLAGLCTVFKSNGYLTPEAIDQLDGLLDAVNVDLKGFDDSYYRRVCGALLQPVLDAIIYLHQRGIWLEVSTLLIPGLNDSDAELSALTSFLAGVSRDIPWHVWRFHPDYRMRDRTWTHVRDVDRAVQLGRAAGLHYVYASNVPGDPNQHTRCPRCGTALIERLGNEIVAIRMREGKCGECEYRVPGVFGPNTSTENNRARAD
jgi:pyruvate formate lyase activating enzyme